SRGRTGVPESFLRMRALMRCRMSSLVLTFMAFLFRAFPLALSADGVPGLPLLGSRARRARLAGLLLQDLARVADPLLLVRIGLAQAPDLGRHLAHLLAVDPGHRQVGLLLD